MNDYFIQSTNNIVRVNRIINGELEAIKINGDLQFLLSEFWPLFKQKIEYEADEKLAFIVFSDDENFEIDSDILIAGKFISTEEDLNVLVFENLTEKNHLITFPKIDLNVDQIMPDVSFNEQLTESELDQDQEIEGDSLQSFFRKKTREMQRDNNKVTGGR